MDVRLGDSDGIDGARAIRRNSGAPVVFLTGLPAAEVERRVSDLEPCRVLAKPVPWFVVRAAIGELHAAATDRTAALSDIKQDKE